MWLLSRSIVSGSLQPHGWWLARLLCSWDSPGKNTGVGCHSLLQRIFQTQDLTQVSHTAGRTVSATWEAPTLCCYHTNSRLSSQWYFIVVLIVFLQWFMMLNIFLYAYLLSVYFFHEIALCPWSKWNVCLIEILFSFQSYLYILDTTSLWNIRFPNNSFSQLGAYLFHAFTVALQGKRS